MYTCNSVLSLNASNPGANRLYVLRNKIKPKNKKKKPKIELYAGVGECGRRLERQAEFYLSSRLTFIQTGLFIVLSKHNRNNKKHAAFAPSG